MPLHPEVWLVRVSVNGEIFHWIKRSNLRNSTGAEGFTSEEDHEMITRIEKQLKRRFAIGSQVSENSIVQDFTRQVRKKSKIHDDTSINIFLQFRNIRNGPFSKWFTVWSVEGSYSTACNVKCFTGSSENWSTSIFQFARTHIIFYYKCLHVCGHFLTWKIPVLCGVEWFPFPYNFRIIFVSLLYATWNRFQNIIWMLYSLTLAID